jgi:hypothetical protein
MLPGPFRHLSFALGATAVVLACSESSTPTTSTTPDSGSPLDAGADTSTASDASSTPKSTCEVTRAWLEGCGHEKNCGDKFDAWCKSNDDAINSGAYRRAEAKCLTQENCEAEKRNDCEYQHYNTETPTAAQKAVIAAYCATCEPGDTSCAVRVIKYDPTAGTKSVGDVFIAAWELNDALCDSIRTKCTGSGVDAGPTPAACTKTFGSCAAEVYLNSVPDCPK